ncbi:ABC transporter ATP-binding protein [Eubacteriales bacterium OttesenSCG-928-G02]|nr:ABC transporter ATP-binding protein [Eubacteriales bacterium OttesenSCG-928-G02]
MIEAKNAVKYFDKFKAVDSITATMKEGSVFGLVGSNGAGKSTFLRMLTGVYKCDEGEIFIDGENVWDNVKAKEKCFFVPDDLQFIPNATPEMMCNYFKGIYLNFDVDRFYRYLNGFSLNKKQKINTFSKGMKRQTAMILALSSGCEYIICDETFDGLDPVARQTIKSLMINDIDEKGITPIIASHNLRELEDICDHVGLLHKGGILFSKDIDDAKMSVHKVQCAFNEEKEKKSFVNLDIIKFDKRGSLITITARGSRDDIVRVVEEHRPIFLEVLPLTLEEIFISETEVSGYDLKELFF